MTAHRLVQEPLPHPWVTVAKFTPLYGLNEIEHYPLIGGHFASLWLLNLVV